MQMSRGQESPHIAGLRDSRLSPTSQPISQERRPHHRPTGIAVCVSTPCDKGLGAHGGKVTGWKQAPKLTSWLDLETVTQSPLASVSTYVKWGWS